MGAKDEPGVLALLAALTGVLYLLTWLVAGAPAWTGSRATGPFPPLDPAAVALARVAG